jgi:hypothetical protein
MGETDMAAYQPTKCVVLVRRGLVEDVVADDDDLQVMIVDYDNEEMSGRREREFTQVRCDVDLVNHVLHGTEVT